MIDPYGVGDDFRRETMSVVTGSGALHEMNRSVGCPRWQNRANRSIFHRVL